MGIRKPGAPPATQLLVRGSDEETWAHLLMYSTNYTALAEALTTSKGMVGRRLLACSDWGFRITGTEGLCNEATKWITAAWSATLDVSNKLYAGLLETANAAKDWAEKALEDAEKALE